jgi:hypothetical protein
MRRGISCLMGVTSSILGTRISSLSLFTSLLFFCGNLDLIPWLVDSEKREKSYECFLDDLRRCEQLGLTVYNFQYASSVLFVIYAHGENCDDGEVQGRPSVLQRLSTLFP